MTTAREIMDDLAVMVQNDTSIPPDHWLAQAVRVNMLTMPETMKLVRLEREICRYEADLIKDGMTAAQAKKESVNHEKYLEWKDQQTLCKQIDEFIKLAKAFSKLNVQMGG